METRAASKNKTKSQSDETEETNDTQSTASTVEIPTATRDRPAPSSSKAAMAQTPEVKSRLRMQVKGLEVNIKFLFNKIKEYKQDPDKATAPAVAADRRKLEKYESTLAELSSEIFAACSNEKEVTEQATALNVINELLDAINIVLSSVEAEVGNSSTKRKVNLPKLQLPTFDGKYEDWLSYRDLITTYIVKNSELTGGEKLGYLKPTLKGEAENIIKNFNNTNGNFEEAWKLITSRYENKREIVFSILRKLLSFKAMSSESPQQLRKLIDTFNESFRSLATLKEPVNTWDSILVFHLIERLSSEIKREWAKSLKGTEVPKFTETIEFLEDYLRGLLASSTATSKPSAAEGSKAHEKKSNVSSQPVTQPQRSNQSQPSSSQSQPVSQLPQWSQSQPPRDPNRPQRKCPACDSMEHGLYRCDQFLNLSVDERVKFVRSKQLCFNCLKPNHAEKQCKGKFNCQKCNKRHHTALHFEKSGESRVEASHITAQAQTITSNHSSSSRVLLSTAVVDVRDSLGDFQPCRVLLDQGSESSMITDRCLRRLGLNKTKSNIIITGISGTKLGKAMGETTFSVSSRITNYSLDVNALVLPRITGTIPSFKCESTEWPHIKELMLADPQFLEPGEIDILIGAEFVASLKTGRKLEYSSSMPVAEETKFGWVISGPVNFPSKFVQVNHVRIEENDISKFWEIEEVPKRQVLTTEERECEEHFVSTQTKTSTGKYQVSLPFKTNHEPLGASRSIAMRRFYNLERRLEHLPHFKPEYHRFMREYEDLGHMEPVPDSECGEIIGRTNYLPHHFVLKETSETTKLRVVFDGSAKTSSGFSLNQCLMVGPTIQNDIFSHLLSFRSNPIALKADISKMYRQFEMSKNDRDFQRILWRTSKLEPVREFRLNTITYGTSSAPFHAVRCLHQIVNDFSQSFPVGAEVLRKNFYVDDLMGGATSTQESIRIFQELTNLLKNAGLEITQWDSNDIETLKFIPTEFQGKNSNLKSESTNLVRALGVCWDSGSDSFHFAGYSPSSTERATKRTILSSMSRVFDPLGFLAPFTVSIKIFFQKLWIPIDLNGTKHLLGWDEEVPPELRGPWIEFEKSIDHLKLIKIPRFLFTEKAELTEIHGFSDGAETAYCAVVYVRCIRGDCVSTNLIASKTKVAPLKQISIPRLELCGALLLARLINQVTEALHLNCQITTWSDSEIVLHWLRNSSRKFKTFVANRIAEIQDVLPAKCWNFVPGKLNPADLGTRGISAEELVNTGVWFRGPDFLRERELPNFESKESIDFDLELKTEKVIINSMLIDTSFFQRFSNLVRLKRAVAYVLRFIYNSRKLQPEERWTGELSVAEIDSAFTTCIRASQREEFAKEISRIENGKMLPKRSQLSCLTPFLDEKGVLRIKGRLHHSNLPEEEKHQIILSGKHQFTKLMIHHRHHLLHHANYQHIFANLRREFWIIKARSSIRRELHQCVKCKRMRAKTYEQMMSNLPKERVTPSSTFEHTGLDYAGPFKAQETIGRGKKQFTVYFCIFICFSTKAVHLEPATDLTTDAFLAALKRFVSRRGLPVTISSDCGSNFVGGANELAEWVKFLKGSNHEIHQFLANQGIDWKFNPPEAPHMGGLWEAGVRSVKYHLRRTVGSQVLTLEEFHTILAMVEAVLNSRPLFAISNDPDSYEALTPGHFLIGKPLTAVPEPSLLHIKENRASRWQRVQILLEHFWKKWKDDYIHSLQERRKWKEPMKNIEVGELVLIKDDDVTPLQWKLAGVTQVFPGHDGLIRTVEVNFRTSQLVKKGPKEGQLTKFRDHTLKRPVVKICPLLPEPQPTEETEEPASP